MSKLVCLKTYPNRSSAEVARSLLEAEGIRCCVSAQDAGYDIAFATGGAKLIVEQSNVDTALEILRSAQTESPDEGFEDAADPSYVWQLRKKARLPRFSLRALFVIVALFALCFAYVASKRRPVYSLRGPLSLPTVYFDNADIDTELATLLGPEYESTTQPSFWGTEQRYERDGGGYVSFDAGSDGKWYVRRFANVGQVYVCVQVGKEEIATWVLRRRLIGSLVHSQQVLYEFDRIDGLLLHWMFSKMVAFDAEEEYLQRIANLLNAPVGYKRGAAVSSKAFGHLGYGLRIELPQKTVTDEQLVRLITYFRELPRLRTVVIGQPAVLSPAQQDKLKAAFPNIELADPTASGDVQLQAYPEKVYPETQASER